MVEIAEKEKEYCTNIEQLCKKRREIENMFLTTKYKTAIIGVGCLPTNKYALGITIDVMEEKLDESTVAKIDAILKNKFRAHYYLGKKSRRLCFREA
jgi:hypothetical protein